MSEGSDQEMCPLSLNKDKSFKACNIIIYIGFFFFNKSAHLVISWWQKEKAGAQLMDLAALQPAFKAVCSHISLKDMQNPIF